MGNIKSRNRIKKFLLVFMSLIICVGLASVVYLYGILDQLGGSNKQAGDVKPKAVKKDEPVNILAMGVDIGTLGLTGSKNPTRTDTILLMNYNPKGEELNIISIPRDTLIMVNKKYKKINEAHAIGGPAYLIDAVEKLFAIKVNYYGKVDYSGFRKVIDSIGPIEMKINNRMDYDDIAQNLHIHFKKGEVVQLDGKKAEEFFRWRKNNDGTGLVEGDIGRIENQHLFISKVIDRLKSPAIIPKVPKLLSVIPNYVESNMKAEDIVKYGYMFSKLDKAKIKTSTLKGDAEYISGISYIIYDEKKNKDIIAMLQGKTEANQ
jgi:LCP family protein required for cell wall assembly